MGLFSFNKKSFNILNSENHTERFLHSFASGGIDFANNNFINDYLEVPEVNAIINIKARAFANMRLIIADNETGNIVKNNEPIIRRLRNPNWFQSQKEFFMQTKIFAEIFGNEFIYFLSPVGMNNNIKGIFTVPPQIVGVELNYSENPFFKEDDIPKWMRYYYNDRGTINYFDKEKLLHINNTNPSYISISGQQNYFTGISQLKSLQPAIQNIRAAYEARNVMIANRGALGILSNNDSDGTGASVPMLFKDKEKLQEDLKNYGVTKKQWQWIITNLNLKWQQIAIDTDKLKLFEEVVEDTKKICDSFGVPYELLGGNGVTYENKLRAEKSFYQNTIIPEADEWVDALNRMFVDKSKTWSIKASFDHLPIFQDDMRNRSSSLVQLTTALDKALAVGAITLEQYKNELKKYGI